MPQFSIADLLAGLMPGGNAQEDPRSEARGPSLGAFLGSPHSYPEVTRAAGRVSPVLQLPAGLPARPAVQQPGIAPASPFAAQPQPDPMRGGPAGLPRPGEDFAGYMDRSGGGEELGEYSGARGMRQPNERAQWEAQMRQTERETGALPVPGYNYLPGDFDFASDQRGEREHRFDQREREVNRGRQRVFTEDDRARDWTRPEIAEDVRGRAPVVDAEGVIMRRDPLYMAAEATGVSRPYLDTLITHESGGDDNAKATTSSATGPAQFIDSTWLRMMREHGQRYGLPRDATDEEILGLRSNRDWAAVMAGEYTQENARTMTETLRRPITEREAYLGHFLGADDAIDLISAAEARLPDARRFVSRGAAEANRRIFYHEDGRPRSALEVVRLQGGDFRPIPLKSRSAP